MDKTVETSFCIRLEYIASGIAPFLDNNLLVLANNIDLENFKDVNVIPEQEKVTKVIKFT